MEGRRDERRSECLIYACSRAQDGPFVNVISMLITNSLSCGEKLPVQKHLSASACEITFLNVSGEQTTRWQQSFNQQSSRMMQEITWQEHCRVCGTHCLKGDILLKTVPQFFSSHFVRSFFNMSTQQTARALLQGGLPYERARVRVREGERGFKKKKKNIQFEFVDRTNNCESNPKKISRQGTHHASNLSPVD